MTDAERILADLLAYRDEASVEWGGEVSLNSPLWDRARRALAVSSPAEPNEKQEGVS